MAIFGYTGKKVSTEVVDSMFKNMNRLVTDNMEYTDGHLNIGVVHKTVGSTTQIRYSEAEMWTVVTTPERLVFEFRDKYYQAYWIIEIEWRSHVYPDTVWLQEHGSDDIERYIPDKAAHYVQLLKNAFTELEGTVLE